jgi:hypothetical protein
MKQIPLTRGMFALVDDEDFEYLNQFKWYAHKDSATYYAMRKKNRKDVRMHRVILGITEPKVFGDHIDHNGLNNQRSNLRIATPAQNQRNKASRKGSSSKYLGVANYPKKNKPWGATISSNNKHYHLGHFAKEEDAARAYNEAAIKYHGEFANLNSIEA